MQLQAERPAGKEALDGALAHVESVTFAERPGSWNSECGGIEAPSLRQRLARGPLDPEEAVDYLVPICQTLVEWHSRGLFHGRLTPEDLFEGGKIASPDLASSGCEGDDLYSLGVILYEMLTGEKPPPRPLPAPAVQQPGLDAIISRLLAPVAVDGYPNIASVATDLCGAWRSPDFVAAATHSKPLGRPALIGRSEQLEALLARLEEGPGACWVVGEAGMGKSYFLREVERYAVAAGYAHLLLSCQPWAHHNPLVGLAAQLLPRLRAEQGFADQLRQVLGPFLPTLVRLLPVMAEIGEAESGDLPEAFMTTRSREALVRLLLALGPDTLLVVEDAHWGQPELLEIFGHPRVLAQLRIVLATREPSQSTAPRVVLEPLSASGIHQLMRSMMGPVEASVARRIADLSGGIPLLAVSLTRQFKEVGEFAWGNLSPTAESLLRERVLSLPESTRRILARAALQGQTFNVELLGESAGPHLDRAEDLGMVSGEEDGRRSFSHQLFSEECQRCLRPSQQRAVHAELAERLSAKRPAPVYEVAHHLWESGDTQGALPWVLRAAKEAQERADLAAASHFLARAVEEDDTHWLALAEVQRLRGRWPEALDGFRKALAVAPDGQSQAFVQGKLGATLWRSGDLAGAAACFRSALDLLGYQVPAAGFRRTAALLRELGGLLAGSRRTELRELTEQEALAARLLDQLAYTSAYSDGVGLIWANLRSLRLTQNARAGAERGVVLASHAVAILNVPALVPRSRRSIEEALTILRQSGSRHDLVCAEARYACVLLFTGQLEAAVQRGSAALAWLETSGDRYDLGICRYNLALALFWQGRHEQARDQAVRGWREACENGDRLAGVYCARVLAAMGHTPEDFYLRYAEPDPHPHVELVRCEVLGLLQLSRFQPALGLPHLEQSLTRARQLGSALDQCWISLWLATAYRLQAEHSPLAQRQDLYRKAGRAARRVLKSARQAYLSFAAHAARELAWSELGLGRPRQARQLFASSEATARQLGQERERTLAVVEAVQAGCTPDRAAEARQLTSGPARGWQLGWATRPERDGQSLARRFEQVVQHGLAVLRCTSTAEVLARTQLAGMDVFGCDECHPLDGDIHEPQLVSEPDTASVLLFPIGVGPALRCAHRSVPQLFGPEELRLAAFLGAVAGAAYHNVELLQQAVADGARLQRILEASPVGLARLDVAGRVVDPNPALRAALGQDIDGVPFEQFVFRDERDAFRVELGRIQQGHSPAWRGEQRYLGHRSNIVWGQITLSRLDREHVLLGLADVSSARLERIALFQESERKLLSIELHDVSQPLLGLRYQLQAEGLQDQCLTVERLLHDMRSLMFDLRTPAVESFSLPQSICDVMYEMGQMSQLQVHLDVEESVQLVTGLAALFTYRIVVEGMSNVRRHAQASRVRLRLRARSGRVCGSLVDDGCGPAPGTAKPRRFGLQGIADRAALLGGWARLRHWKNHGTVLHFQFPFENA